MPKNDSFKKKELNKKDYQGKEKAAKTIKKAAATAGAVAAAVMIFKRVIKFGKGVIFKG